ncbi:hypothetical protein ADUPG1_012028, partial [Aduncisulcus paluster]
MEEEKSIFDKEISIPSNIEDDGSIYHSVYENGEWTSAKSIHKITDTPHAICICSARLAVAHGRSITLFRHKGDVISEKESPQPFEFPPLSATFTYDDEILAVGLSDGNVAFVSVLDPENVDRTKVCEDGIISIASSRQSGQVVCLSAGGLIRVFDDVCESADYTGVEKLLAPKIPTHKFSHSNVYNNIVMGRSWKFSLNGKDHRALCYIISKSGNVILLSDKLKVIARSPRLLSSSCKLSLLSNKYLLCSSPSSSSVEVFSAYPQASASSSMSILSKIEGTNKKQGSVMTMSKVADAELKYPVFTAVETLDGDILACSLKGSAWMSSVPLLDEERLLRHQRKEEEEEEEIENVEEEEEKE